MLRIQSVFLLHTLLLFGVILLTYLIIHEGAKILISQKRAILEPKGEWDDELREFALQSLDQPMEPIQIREFSQRLRLYGRLLDQYERKHGNFVPMSAAIDGSTLRITTAHKNTSIINPYGEGGSFIWKLEKDLFPWSHRKYSCLLELKQSFKGKRGMIVSTGSKHFHFTVHLIRHVRYLKFPYPIVVAYSGEGDLKAWERVFLQKMDVPLINLLDYFVIEDVDQWFTKIFAMLAAPFEEVILADGDTVFLQNPVVLFEDPGYMEHGLLLFKDKNLGDTGGIYKTRRDWLKTNLPVPLSSRIRNGRIYRMKSRDEIESGVVVWSRSKRFLCALGIAKFNLKHERDMLIFGKFHGDKETYMFGPELAGESWDSPEYAPGTVGEVKFDNKSGKLEPVGGKMAHFDRNGRPLWLQASIVVNKSNVEGLHRIHNLTYYRQGKRYEEDDESSHEVVKITGKMRQDLDRIIELYHAEIANTTSPYDRLNNNTLPSQ